MDDYLQLIRTVQLSQERKYSQHLLDEDRENEEYRSLAGVLIYLEQEALSQACFVASWMQQKIALLKVGHLFEANSMVYELRTFQPFISFLALGAIL